MNKCKFHTIIFALISMVNVYVIFIYVENRQQYNGQDLKGISVV